MIESNPPSLRHRVRLWFVALAPWFVGAVAWLVAGAAFGSWGTATAAAFDPEAATRAYLDTVSVEDKLRSDAYFEGGYWIQLWSFLLGAALHIGLLRYRISARMRDIAERVTRFWPVHVIVYFLIYLLITTIVLFPWSIYTGFFREHAYDLANQGFGEWFGERMKGLVLGAVLGGIAVVLAYLMFRKAARAWWAWSTGIAVVFLSIMMMLGPVFIQPIFNDYEAIGEGPVKSAVLRMAHANGIVATDVYMSDASRQSKRISANVSGFLGTERITLNDNLLERCSQGEIEAVMGHEIGHYVLNHMHEGLVFMAVMMLSMFAFVGIGFRHVLRRFGKTWGVEGIADPAGLPLLVFLFSVIGFLLTPVTNSYVRMNEAEAEADAFGLNAARQPDGFATVALKLGEYRKLEPGPLEEFILFDHPSGRERILMGMRFKAVMLEMGEKIGPRSAEGAQSAEP
ncbi:MAG: M48 family metallopeptidase [Nannocystaceae bacterium]